MSDALLQDPTRSKTATVLAIQQLRHGHPSMSYPDQNIVLQTSEAETVQATPGENPLVDLMHRYATDPLCTLPHITCLHSMTVTSSVSFCTRV